MNQNDFGPSAAAVGAGAAAAAAPIPPFDNHRYPHSPQPMYNTTASVPSEPYNDYHEGYSQVGGYSQGGYSQEAFHPDNAGYQDNYGYYGYGAGHQGYDTNAYYNEQAYMQPQQHQNMYPTSPTTVSGNMSEAGYHSYSGAPGVAPGVAPGDKPNLKEYNKPNEL